MKAIKQKNMQVSENSTVCHILEVGWAGVQPKFCKRVECQVKVQ